jgi:hypothetical protein
MGRASDGGGLVFGAYGLLGGSLAVCTGVRASRGGGVDLVEVEK